MIAVPPATPVTTPPATVAVVGSLVLQAPPDTDSLNVVVPPAQTLATPVIADGTPFIVIGTTALQPVGIV